MSGKSKQKLKEPFLFGLSYANHDFTDPISLGKNIFTNAFPISVIQYLAIEKQFDMPLVKAVIEDKNITTKQEMTSWASIIDTDPSKANFLFETTYDGYRAYTNNIPNNSDIVVTDKNQAHKIPFEVK